MHSLGMGRSTSGIRISTRPWYSTLSQCLVHCSTGSNLDSSTKLALGSRFSASSCLQTPRCGSGKCSLPLSNP